MSEQMLTIPGDFGEWIEVADAKLPVGHIVWTVTRIHFNRSRAGYLRAHGVTSAGRVWIPLENPPFWLESLIREAESIHVESIQG